MNKDGVVIHNVRRQTLRSGFAKHLGAQTLARAIVETSPSNPQHRNSWLEAAISVANIIRQIGQSFAYVFDDLSTNTLFTDVHCVLLI